MTIIPRCSPRRFLKLVQSLDEEKKKAIADVGFGGLLDLQCTVLQHDLCEWLLEHYDASSSQLELESNECVPITPHDVHIIMGIPSRGMDLVLEEITQNKLLRPLPSFGEMEESLKMLKAGDEFKRMFVLFACTMILVPCSKLEGKDKLVDVVQDVAAIPLYNWGKLVVDVLAKGKMGYLRQKEYMEKPKKRKRMAKRKEKQTSGSLLFLQMFYLHRVHVGHGPVATTTPLMRAWTDQLISERIKWEKEGLGGFGKGVLRRHVPAVRSPSFDPPHELEGERENVIMASIPRNRSRKSRIIISRCDLQILEEKLQILKEQLPKGCISDQAYQNNQSQNNIIAAEDHRNNQTQNNIVAAEDHQNNQTQNNIVAAEDHQNNQTQNNITAAEDHQNNQTQNNIIAAEDHQNNIPSFQSSHEAHDPTTVPSAPSSSEDVTVDDGLIYSPSIDSSSLTLSVSTGHEAHDTASVPSAPPLSEGVMDDGPVYCPSIDSNPFDMFDSTVEDLLANKFQGKENDAFLSCIICYDAPVEGACVPCGHMAGCISCLNVIKANKNGCPLCRAKIDQVIRLYAV